MEAPSKKDEKKKQWKYDPGKFNIEQAAKRIRENKGVLLSASKKRFKPIETDDDINYALNTLKRKIKSITYCCSTTNTPVGLGVLHLEYKISDIWVTEGGKLIFHIDVDGAPVIGNIDRDGKPVEKK